MSKPQNIWPSVFITGIIPEGYREDKLLGECLIAYCWIQQFRRKPPLLFYPTLFLISDKVGFLCTKENILFHLKSRGALA